MSAWLFLCMNESKDITENSRVYIFHGSIYTFSPWTNYRSQSYVSYYFSCLFRFLFSPTKRTNNKDKARQKHTKREICRQRERKSHNFRSMHSSLSINFQLTSNFNFHEKQKFALARKATIHPNTLALQ